MKPVRVLVVDDSASMRALIAHKLSSDPTIQVVGQAADPLQAREAIKALNPDVMTLDVEMPKMNGIEFLEKVMRLRPLPVLMVSSLTERGAAATLSAMEIGAVDCIAKPSPENPDAFDDLPAKVHMAAQARVGVRAPITAPRPNGAAAVAGPALNGRIVAIGASTGGVEAVLSILSTFPRNCPPTLVTLHLPAPFTKTFVQRLDRLCQPEVREATDGAPIVAGRVYIAPGSFTHLEVGRGEPLRCALRSGRCDQRAPALGRRAVPFRREGGGRQGRRRHTHRHGRRRRQGPAGNAQGRRAHHRAGRGDLRRLRHAENRLSNRGGRAPIALEPDCRRYRRNDVERASEGLIMSMASKLEVMVVDDTSVSRMLITESLNEIGINNLALAKDGKQALDALMKKPVHLVISDQNMPGLDGLGLLKALREFKPTSRIGFILVTGSPDKSLIERGRTLGLNNFIAKPFNTKTVRTAIEAVVGKLS